MRNFDKPFVWCLYQRGNNLYVRTLERTGGQVIADEYNVKDREAAAQLVARLMGYEITPKTTKVMLAGITEQTNKAQVPWDKMPKGYWD